LKSNANHYPQNRSQQTHRPVCIPDCPFPGCHARLTESRRTGTGQPQGLPLRAFRMEKSWIIAGMQLGFEKILFNINLLNFKQHDVSLIGQLKGYFAKFAKNVCKR
jgi:hypothetical protein